MRSTWVRNMSSSKRIKNSVSHEYIIIERDSEDRSKVYRTTFQSYRTTVAIIDWGARVITLGRDWDCTPLTGHYRKEFFRQYGFKSLKSWGDLREAVENGFTRNRRGELWEVRVDETL